MSTSCVTAAGKQRSGYRELWQWFLAQVTDLKELCRQHGVVGFSALRKAELVEALVALKA